MTTVGFLTIGQAPRDDVTPEVLAHFSEVPDIIEAGALDQYESAQAVEDELSPDPGDPRYVTRMADGTSVTIRKHDVHELIQDRIQELESKVDVIGLLCTGSFPEYDTTVPLLKPSELLYSWASAISPETIGVLIPDPDQEEQTHDKWGDQFEVVPLYADPYNADTSFATAASELQNRADLIIMDCIGYSESMKRTIREGADTPVLLGRSVLAKTAEEVL